MYRINYFDVVARKTATDRMQALLAEIEKADYICLTDAIVHMNQGGAMMLPWLADDEINGLRSGRPRKFKIQVLRNEWGVTPPELKTVERKITRPLKDSAGRPLTSRMIADMKRRGDFEKRYIETRVFPIDEKGCIECTYEDAASFLQDYGVHFESGVAICGRRETSSGPCKAPDGQQRHVWYWRYKEAPPEVYERLPILRKQDNNKR